MGGWYGNSQKHAMASKGIRTTMSNKEFGRRREYFDNPELSILKQIEFDNFPIVIYPRNVMDYNDTIEYWAKLYEIDKKYVKMAFEKITLSWSEFIDLFDIKEDAYSNKEWAKDEYREYRREAREDGWLQEVPPFNQWHEETYGYQPTVKEYLRNMDNEDKMKLVKKMIDDVEGDLGYFADFELIKIRDKLAR